MINWWGWALLAAVLCGLAYAGVRLMRERAQARERIGAARVRSGHVPLEIPTMRGGVGDEGPDTFPHWARQDRHEQVVVDEQPRIHIRYHNMLGKFAESTIQVEYLDLRRRVIVARTGSVDTTRYFPLEKIQQARNVETGKPFNLATWVDAVAAARRRHETQSMPGALIGHDEGRLA